MPKLVKNNNISSGDDWQLARDISTIEDIPDSGKVALPPTLFSELKPSSTDERELGLVIPGDAVLENIEELITQVKFIAIDFPAFMDGRGFSSGRLLRDEYEFDGELRAVGDFMLDQLFYLSRCGFNSFEVSEEHSDDDIQKCLSAFSESYQAASDDPQPLFRRRA